MPRQPQKPPQKTEHNPDPLGDALAASVGETPDEETVTEAPDEYQAVFVQQVPAETEKIVEKPDRLKKPEASSKIPNLDEWQDFIGRFVIRGITEAYLSMVLGDIEEELTPRERQIIQLTKDDMRDLSAPIASLAHKSKMGRKYGRTIISAADSGEAVIALAIWMRRVNRIAKKYRKVTPTVPQTIPGYVMENGNGTDGPNVGQGPEFGGPGFGVFNPGTG